MSDGVAIVSSYTNITPSGTSLSFEPNYSSVNAGGAAAGGAPTVTIDVLLASQEQIMEAINAAIVSDAAVNGINIVRVIHQATAFVVLDV